MKKHVKRITVQAFGVAFLLLGTAGLVLPILQGVLFLIIGLLLLSLYSERIRAFVHRWARKHKKAEYYVERIERFLNRFVGTA